LQSWKSVAVHPKDSIRKAISFIDQSGLQIALVVDEADRLLGVITDGDVRRGILKGVSIDEPVTEVMNTNPQTVKFFENREEIFAKMKALKLRQIPIVDEDNRVIGLETLDFIIQPQLHNNLVVIMAGGIGSRLNPLTNDCPKPLLRIEGRPILEIIIENLREYGFYRFILAVNYKGEMIREYFGDGPKWGVEIQYIMEKKSMGTAGALSLLPERPLQSILVMNGDLLTKVNFNQLLHFHLELQSTATMCVREFGMEVPYGVAKTDNDLLIGIEEKPVYRFFANAGIYVLEPEALDMVPKDSFFDMTSLFEKMISERKKTVVFPIREYWLDIGQMGDFGRAKDEYNRKLF
jgi:dTDP-glucose pyrophosphorylase/predicted transcriptional regulator